MSTLGLFLVGVAVSIPAAAGIVGLVWAAIADGRDNDRDQEALRSARQPVG